MVIFDGDPHLLHLQAHLTAALVGFVKGLGHMVTLLVRDHTAHSLVGAVPIGLLDVQRHTCTVGLNLPARLVKEIKLKLGQNQHRVGNAGIPHILFGSQDNISGVLVQRMVVGIADHHGVARH